MLNPIPNVRGSGYDVIKKLRFRERKFALFLEHELPPPDTLILYLVVQFLIAQDRGII